MTTVYPIPKPGEYEKRKPEKDEKYRNFIRSQPCLICGGKSQHHHESLSGGTMGGKCDDRESLPLCHYHHNEERHQWGRETFYKKYGIDYAYEISRLQNKFKKYHKK